jgi:tRNA-2-methylthio-N6-dimethylallyladenosine synthase
MNVLDSELARAELMALGYRPTDSRSEADIILYNTCSVRRHAEDKIYSALGRLKHWKRHRPQGILCVLGCMAQKDQRTIFRRAPHVDLVLGPGQLHRLGEVIARLEQEKSLPREVTEPGNLSPSGVEWLEVSLTRGHAPEETVRESYQPFHPPRVSDSRESPHQAMVRIMVGCNNFCTYCIVPSVRGPEQSRPPGEILREIRQLADQGCLEVTLIGQTVNRYRYTEGEKTTRLADLLEGIQAIEGIRRVKFVTNAPGDMTDALLRAVRELDKVSPFLHVPAQSGSDAILQRMRRGYTSGEYRRMIERIRHIVPEAAVTSDFIVGFCGETEEDFRQTVDLVRFGQFKNSFIFKYSEREGTVAARRYQDDVPYPVKQRRNNELLAIQNEISLSLNEPFRNRRVEILVEGLSKNSRKKGDPPGRRLQYCGRTECDRIVVFESDDPGVVGKMIPVEITDVAPFTLYGKRVEEVDA